MKDARLLEGARLFFGLPKDARQIESARLLEGARLFFRASQRWASIRECAFIRGCASIRRNTVYSDTTRCPSSFDSGTENQSGWKRTRSNENVCPVNINVSDGSRGSVQNTRREIGRAHV